MEERRYAGQARDEISLDAVDMHLRNIPLWLPLGLIDQQVGRNFQ